MTLRDAFTPRPLHPRSSSVRALLAVTVISSVYAEAVHAQRVSECEINVGAPGRGLNTLTKCFTGSLQDESTPNLRICPSADVRVGYSDNVFRTEDGVQGDGFVRFRPAVTFELTNQENTGKLSASTLVNRQFRRKANNFVDFSAEGRTNFSIGEDLVINTAARLKRGHDNRERIESVGRQLRLAKFLEGSAAAGFTLQSSNGFVSAGQLISHRTFTDRPGNIAAGRDATRYRTRACLGVRTTQRTTGVLTSEIEVVDRIDERLPSANDNYTASALASLFYELSGVTRLRVGVGYIRSGTIDGRSDSVDTVAARGILNWSMTELTRLTASVSTTVRQTNTGTSGFLLQRRQSLNVFHDLHPFVSLAARLSHTSQDVSGSQARANTVSGGIRASYLLASNTAIGADFEHARRLGSSGGRSFVSNSIFVGLRTTF